MLWSTLLIAGLFRALDAFRVFDLVYVLTGGGPADSTETLSTLSYKTLFSTLQFGYGSTLSTAMFITEAVIAAGFAIFIVAQDWARRDDGHGATARAAAALIGSAPGAILVWSAGALRVAALDLVPARQGADRADTVSCWPSPRTLEHYYNVFVVQALPASTC